jgi:hypothetical protein
MSNCYFCGASLEAPIYRSSECPQCGKDSKICRNCEFYSETSHWECRESISEAVQDKERSNYCDFFRLAKARKKQDKSRDSLDAFNKLFGD